MQKMQVLLLALLPVLSMCAPAASAAYSLVDNCVGSSFLNCFTFFSQGDPTHGFVRYLNEADAKSQGLFTVSGSTVTLAVDAKNKAPNGRASVRLHSKKLYNKGLFVLDLAHMPSSTCGTWPSFWSWGSEVTWPANGEIDIIEGVHTQSGNAMSLHTSDGCSIDGLNSAGHVATKNCFIGAPGQTSNAGCGISDPSPSSYGTPFNAAGGGIYAVEWASSSIKIWFFPRNNVPSDLAGSSPDPSKWPTPQASFQGGCDFGKHFIDQRFVVDTTFCGDWAGAVWGSNPTCSKLAANCNDYVNNNPSAFSESYWKINSFKTFRQ